MLVGWNDLTTVNPDLAAELVDTDLAPTYTQGSKKSIGWFCDGTAERPHPRYKWTAMVTTRSHGHGCPVCAGKVVLVGWNDLTTVNLDLAAELVDPDLATTLTENSGKRVGWFCDGTAERPHPRYEWTARVADRSAGTGCAVCAPTGFDPSRPAWLYFLRHDGWAMQQIGITNNPEQCIGQHKRSGWELVEIRKYDDGVLCASTEQAALTALRLRGARLGNDQHRFDGYTESWDTLSLDLDGLDQLLEWVRA